MYIKTRKIVAIMLIFILAITHFSIVGEVLANSLENQNTKTNIDNIEFDVYFNDNGKVHSATKSIGEENYIYAAINVKDAGYLKSAQVEIKDANFEILEGKNIEKVSQIEANKIYLNRIKSGETVEVAIPIQMMQEDTKINLSQFSKESVLSLSGTYVNEDGKEKQVKKDITVCLSWTNVKEAELNSDIITYIPNYELENRKVTIMQMSLDSYLNNNTLPLKENKIEISIPSINNEKPEEVKVSSVNGNSNFEYDVDREKLTITTKNEKDKNNNISWEKDIKDSFIVTLIYNTINDNSLDISYDVKSELTVYEANISKVTKDITVNKTMKDKIGNIVDFEIKAQTEKISKGLLYVNNEVEYKQSIIANVKLAKIGQENLLNEIILEKNEDNFVTKENTKLSAKNSTDYKTIAVNKEGFRKILGESGEIKIYSGNEIVTTINSAKEANKEGNIIIDLPEGGFDKIQISSPVSEGELVFDITKKISKDSEFTKEQIKQFEKMELNLNIKETKNIEEKIVTEEITFIDPISQAEIIIDNSNLSTVVTNQNVKITSILKTDTEDCSLYTNPVLSITLPKYIEEIKIKNIEVLFDTEGSKLELKSHNIIKNEDGTQTIYIELTGAQTEYTLLAVSKGVNVIITSDITVNKLTANRQEQLVMQYTNNNTNARSVGETKTVSTAINFVAPTGLVTTTTISDYEENKEPLTVISNEDKIVTLPIMSKQVNAKFTMNVINNYNNTIDNVVVLGRTLFEGNKNILTGEDLGTNINMPLTSTITVNGIDTSKVKVYYSENGQATKDLSQIENKWTETVSDLSKVKSYLIVLEDFTMNTSDSVSFEYTAKVPENLVHNKTAYENYAVYFNNNLETGTIEDKQMAAKIGLTTGKGPVLDIQLFSDAKETEVVTTGKFIKYTLSVKNAGEEVAQNVVATVNIPKATSYIEFFNGEAGQYTIDDNKEKVSFEIGSIEVGKTIEKSFFVIVDKISEEDFCLDETHYQEYEGVKYHKRDAVHQKEDYKLSISAKANVSAKDLAKELQSNEVVNNVKDAYFSISTSTTTNGMKLLNENDTFKFNISVRKYDVSDNIKDAVVTYVVPEGLNYQKAYIEQYNVQSGKTEQVEENVTYNEKTRTVSINLGAIDINDNRSISIVTNVDKLLEAEYERKIQNIAKVTSDKIEETSNIITDTIAKEGFEVTQTSNIPEQSTISAGDKFSYKIIVKNIGGNDLGTLKIIDNLPKELQYVNTEYEIENETKTIVNINEENKTEVTLNIPKGKTATITINVVAKELAQDTTIENKATVTSSTLEKQTNSITHIIEKYLEESKEEITDSNNTNRKIMGTVWKDVNNNGKRDNEEEKVSNVEVVLFNNETGKYVENSEGEMLKVTTDNNGNYTFTNIPKGKYTVVFLYDVANYSATTYRKENVDATLNSDVIDRKITINQEERLAGITEEIAVENSNIYNIDLGLIENAKFDLRLDKTVSKITIQEGKKTTVYDYKDTKLAKKDLIGKEVNDVSIVVEYKIKVTNEGAVAGYVKKIADYIPSQMKFNSELNRDWYTAGAGVLFNSSLANTAINPGESREVTLTLTKKMTEDNLGLYHNEAEIYEAYNDLGLVDIDSKVANKISNEDDMSSADVIMTIKTGQMISFVGLSIGIITSIAVGAYFVKKKVLR